MRDTRLHTAILIFRYRSLPNWYITGINSLKIVDIHRLFYFGSYIVKSGIRITSITPRAIYWETNNSESFSFVLVPFISIIFLSFLLSATQRKTHTLRGKVPRYEKASPFILLFCLANVINRWFVTVFVFMDKKRYTDVKSFHFFSFISKHISLGRSFKSTRVINFFFRKKPLWVTIHYPQHRKLNTLYNTYLICSKVNDNFHFY